MIQFARAFAGSGLLWLWTGLALAQAPAPAQTPTVAPAATQAPAEKEPALKSPPARRAPRITAATPECAWTGRRIVSLLIRDDVDTAEKFRRFYESFDCPADHIAPAMRCVVVSENAENQAKALAERVDACWDKPSVRFLNR